MLMSSLLLLTFLLSDPDGPANVDIHDVPIFHAAAVITVSLPCRWPPCMLLLHYFCQHPRFCWRPYCAGRPVVAFIPAVMLLLSSLLLLVAGVTSVACISDVTGIPAVAGIPLVPDVLTVASLPAIVASLMLSAFLLLLAFLLWLVSLLFLAFHFSWCLYKLYCYSVQCRMRHIRLSDYGFRTVIFFCYETIRISNIGLENQKNYRISDQGFHLTDYRLSD
jgi:hypothetical protein